MGRVKEQPDPLANAWATAKDVLHDGHIGFGHDMVGAYIAALGVLEMGIELFDAPPGPRRSELLARFVAVGRVAYEVPADSAGRLRAMKSALNTVVTLETRLHGPGYPRDERRQKSLRDMLMGMVNPACFEAPTIGESSSTIVDRALKAEMTPNLKPKRLYWEALHALAKALDCGSACDESFRTRYVRLKL